MPPKYAEIPKSSRDTINEVLANSWPEASEYPCRALRLIFSRHAGEKIAAERMHSKTHCSYASQAPLCRDCARPMIKIYRGPTRPAVHASAHEQGGRAF